jgi:hypothetical protein
MNKNGQYTGPKDTARDFNVLHVHKRKVSYKTGHKVRPWFNTSCVFFTDYTVPGRTDKCLLDSKTAEQRLGEIPHPDSGIRAVTASVQRGKETGRLHIQGVAWAAGGPYTLQDWRKMLGMVSGLLEPCDSWSAACTYISGSKTNCSAVKEYGAYGDLTGWQLKRVDDAVIQQARESLLRLTGEKKTPP